MNFQYISMLNSTKQRYMLTISRTVFVFYMLLRIFISAYIQNSNKHINTGISLLVSHQVSMLLVDSFYRWFVCLTVKAKCFLYA